MCLCTGGEVGHSGDDSSAEQTLYDLYAMSVSQQFAL